MRFSIRCVFVLGLAGTPALAATWYVGPGGDFAQIQPAIDAAQEGDLIFVVPGPTYDYFVLRKALTICVTSGRFKVKGASVTGIETGKSARLTGLDIDDAGLSIRDCPGRVIAEDVACRAGYAWWSPWALLEMSNCSFVHLTGISVDADRFQYTYDAAAGTVVVESSDVVLTDVHIQGWSAAEADPGQWGEDGLAALFIAQSSRVVLANCDITGGAGGQGGYVDLCGWPGTGGEGGPGVRVQLSDLLIVGCCPSSIRGGRGGDGGTLYMDRCVGKGGDGGPGLIGTSALVSDVALSGGEGGCGQPPGMDGEPYVGNIEFADPRLPSLAMAGDIHPGSNWAVGVNAATGDRVWLVVSSDCGWVDLPRFRGAPFSAVPGLFFVGFPAGTVGPSGSLIVNLGIIEDPVVQGLALTAQAAVLGETPPALTNAATRVVRE
ncbi:MAG: hypothetical protein AB1486_24245 [Planctomycetota bacterium]